LRSTSDRQRHAPAPTSSPPVTRQKQMQCDAKLFRQRCPQPKLEDLTRGARLIASPSTGQRHSASAARM
jgi:hypothetical protein